MKAIAVLRVSTDVQQIDDQRDELFEFIRSHGYEDIIPIEAVGASAIKMNDRYVYMVQKIKDTILSDKEVDSVFVWELSRLGRNEVVLMEFKEFFIKNHIQFICKNPYMKLLNEDGSINTGMELAFSLYATMTKQEMDEKKERFKRAKAGMSRKGMYTGGHTIPFGYKVVDKKFVIDEEKADIVRSIFDMYSTGMWSTYTLEKEMADRGHHTGNIGRILRNRAYIGEANNGKYSSRYPQIISRELFEKCRSVRKNNMMDMKKKGIALGAKIVRCPVCGAVCTSNSRHYACCRKYRCGNRFNLSRSVADELLYRNAYGLHMMYLLNLKEGKMDEYKKELESLEGKIAAAEKKIDTFNSKKQRILETYLDGFISKKDRDIRLLKVEDEARFQRDFISQLQDKRRAIMRLLDGDEIDSVENFMKTYEAMSSEDKYEIIHKHIESLVAVPESYGKRDPRSKRENAVHITIKAIEGSTVEYLYFPMLYQGKQLYVLIDGEWVPDSLDGAVYAMPLD